MNGSKAVTGLEHQLNRGTAGTARPDFVEMQSASGYNEMPGTPSPKSAEGGGTLTGAGSNSPGSEQADDGGDAVKEMVDLEITDAEITNAVEMR